MKCDGTRAETRFRLSAKWTSPFKSVGASVQSTTGSRGVRIGSSNAGYTIFRGSVKSTGYPLHSPVSTFTSPLVQDRVPSHFNWTLIYINQHFVFEVQPPTFIDIYLCRHLKILSIFSCNSKGRDISSMQFFMPVRPFLTALGPLKKMRQSVIDVSMHNSEVCHPHCVFKL